MTNEIAVVEETISAAEMLNGVFDIKMKGNWDIKPKVEGLIVVRAESIVGEFLVDSVRRGEYKGKEEVFLNGTDYYNRELSLPMSRVIAVNKRDTDEQSKLKTCNLAIDILKSICTEEDDSYARVLKTAKDLESQGVTEYIPRRAQ